LRYQFIEAEKAQFPKESSIGSYNWREEGGEGGGEAVDESALRGKSAVVLTNS